jgi:hypothetical protein
MPTRYEGVTTRISIRISQTSETRESIYRTSGHRLSAKVALRAVTDDRRSIPILPWPC